MTEARARYIEQCERQGIPVVEVSAKVRKELKGWPKGTYLKPKKATIDKLYREWHATKSLV